MKNLQKEIRTFIDSLELKELNAEQQSVLLAGDENKGACASNQMCDNSLNSNCQNEYSCHKSTNTLTCTNSFQCGQAHNKDTCSSGKGNKKTQGHETKYL